MVKKTESYEKITRIKVDPSKTTEQIVKEIMKANKRTLDYLASR